MWLLVTFTLAVVFPVVSALHLLCVFFFSGILSYQLLQEFLSLPLEPVCKICFRTLDNSHLDVISELAKLRFLDKVVYKYNVRSYLNSREFLKTDFIFINLYLTLPLPPLRQGFTM